MSLFNIQPPDFSNFFEIQWQERIDARSPNSSQFAINRSQAELVAIMPWGAEGDAIKQILGYQYVDTVGQKLCRVLPLRHPRYRWLFGSRIHGLRGLNPTGKTVAVALGEGPGGASRLRAWMAYEKIEFTVLFEPVPYRVLRDDEITSEADRFVEPMPQPGEDVIQQQASTMKFAEGSGTGGEPVSGGSGTVFPRTLGVIAAKNFYTLRWHRVSLDFVSGDRGISFPQFEAVLGKVNDAEFLGKPAGTLLFRAPKINIYPQSVNVLDESEPSLLADIDLTFHFYDPSPRGGSARGHNLVPYLDLQYYLATADGLTNGRGVYETGDFSKIFSHHEA